jgi:hypothetical protein
VQAALASAASFAAALALQPAVVVASLVKWVMAGPHGVKHLARDRGSSRTARNLLARRG